MSRIKASVVTPMYNSEKTILELLNSMNEQTEKNFEMIIVDDGSKDNSLKIIKEFKPKFKLRIIEQKNFGPAIARNKGAIDAKTDIILFVDSDCVPREDFVEKILEPLKDKDVAGVQGEYETKNKNSLLARYIGYEIYFRHEKMRLDGKAEKIDHVGTYACAYRKKDFGKGFITLFKKADMEDIELSYRIAKLGRKLVFQPEAIVKHPHPEKLGKFLKQTFSRGYWRVLGHKMHPDKMLGDSYMGTDIVVQGGLSGLFIATFIFSIIWSLVSFSLVSFILPLINLLALILLNLPLGIYASKREFKMIFIAPLIATIRAIVGTLGFVYGVIQYTIFKKERVLNEDDK